MLVSGRLRAAMKLSELIVPDLVEIPFRAADKWQALQVLAQVPVRAGRYPEDRVASVHEALKLREKSMSTGMENGIAIPHAAVDGLDDLVAVLGICHEGIEFEAVDRKPAHILVGLVIPRHKKLMHIKTLAEIAKLLSRAEVRQRLVECQTADEVCKSLVALESAQAR